MCTLLLNNPSLWLVNSFEFIYISGFLGIIFDLKPIYKTCHFDSLTYANNMKQ